MNKHDGSTLDSLFEELGELEEVDAMAAKKILVVQAARRMKELGLTTTALAERMRTSRNQVHRILDERDAGITLYSATTGEDVTASIAEDPMREALVLVQGVFAQTEKRLLVRKLAKARAAMRARGERCEGRRPYGSDVIEALRTLRRKRKGERLSFAGCAARLQELGLATKSGKPWQAMTVRTIARREGIV